MDARRPLVALLALLLLAPAAMPPAGAQQPGPLPDLVVEPTEPRPQPMFEGDFPFFCFTIHNLGDATAGNFTVHARVDGEHAGGVQVSVGGFNGTVGLGPGNSTSSCTFGGWNPVRGEHLVEVEVDVLGEVAESDEGNNVAGRTFRVAGPEDLDVAVVSAEFFFGPPTAAGDQVTVLADVANLGAFTMLVDVDLLVDSAREGGTFVFLGPGETIEVFLSGPRAVPGRHEVTVRAAPFPDRGEREEGNNEASLTYEVLAPDLEVDDLEVRPGRPDAGLPATLHARVRNAGPGLARFPAVQLDVEGVLRTTMFLNDLRPGESERFELGWVFPAGGERRFTVTADPFESLFDRDPADNEARLDFRVVQPDPAIAGIAAERRLVETELTGPLAPNPLAPMEVRVEVANLGDGRAWRAANASAAYTLDLTACATVDAPLPRGPLPVPQPPMLPPPLPWLELPGLEPPTPPAEQCEEVASWQAQDGLAAGASRVFEARWDTLGRVGDFELCARLVYENPQTNLDNDLGCRRVSVLVGGTGLGGFFLLP